MLVICVSPAPLFFKSLLLEVYQVLVIFLENQLFVMLIFSSVFLFSTSLFSAPIFIISFLPLALGLVKSFFSDLELDASVIDLRCFPLL